MSFALRARNACGCRVASRSRKSLVVRAVSTVSEREAQTLAYLKSLPGITAPFPDVFDPAGLAKTASVSDLKRWRESEITHGRVAMLASLGFLIGEQLEDFPAFLNFDGNITGPAITQFQQVQKVRPGFWEALTLFIAIAEAYRVGLGWATPVGTGFNALKEEYEPGNLGFDPLNLKPTDPAALKEMQTKELNNGRLAMIAIAAFVVQELVAPGTEVFQHAFLRFEEEVILELDDVERDLGLPVTPVPELILKELGQK